MQLIKASLTRMGKRMGKALFCSVDDTVHREKFEIDDGIDVLVRPGIVLENNRNSKRSTILVHL